MSHRDEITDVKLLYFQNALHATSPSVWLPYTAMDQLLVLLKDVQPDSELAKVRSVTSNTLHLLFLNRRLILEF